MSEFDGSTRAKHKKATLDGSTRAKCSIYSCLMDLGEPQRSIKQSMRSKCDETRIRRDKFPLPKSHAFAYA